MSEKKAKKSVPFLWGVITGAIIGGVSGLLFAPKKGSELRQDIKEGTEKAIEASSKTIQQVSNTISEAGKSIESKALQVVQGAKQGIQKVTQLAQERKAKESEHENTALTSEEIDKTAEL